jgi:hypothetical protein
MAIRTTGADIQTTERCMPNSIADTSVFQHQDELCARFERSEIEGWSRRMRVSTQLKHVQSAALAPYF